MEIDELDNNILDILKNDARTPFTEIGRELGVSDATIHVRVNKLIGEGVIEKFTIEVDEKAIGDQISGFVFIDVEPGMIEEVVENLIVNERVHEIYEIHGSHDLIVKAITIDLDEMRELILEIRETPNIVSSEMATIFRKWK